MVYYGEEIGMGEQMSLPGRLVVRAPMQWAAYDNGGFSHASPKCFVRPMVSDGPFGFEHSNVASQRADPGSLLNWMAELIRTRRESSEIGAGPCRILDTGDEAVLGIRHGGDDSAIITLNNLSDRRTTITLDLAEREMMTATDLFGSRKYAPIDAENRSFRLEGYGYRWLRLGGIY
ncbi:MAG: hypothetical protein M3Z20_07730 [Chloroflexota bacterium]|nr:hypothetical protein [Chloroflexota bacterium]